MAGPIVTQTLAKGMLWALLQRCRGDFCMSLKLAVTERTVPSLSQGGGRRAPRLSVNTTGSKALGWLSDRGAPVAFPWLQLHIATHRLAYKYKSQRPLNTEGPAACSWMEKCYIGIVSQAVVFKCSTEASGLSSRASFSLAAASFYLPHLLSSQSKILLGSWARHPRTHTCNPN